MSCFQSSQLFSHQLFPKLQVVSIVVNYRGAAFGASGAASCVAGGAPPVVVVVVALKVTAAATHYMLVRVF